MPPIHISIQSSAILSSIKTKKSYISRYHISPVKIIFFFALQNQLLCVVNRIFSEELKGYLEFIICSRNSNLSINADLSEFGHDSPVIVSLSLTPIKAQIQTITSSVGFTISDKLITETLHGVVQDKYYVRWLLRNMLKFI